MHSLRIDCLNDEVGFVREVRREAEYVGCRLHYCQRTVFCDRDCICDGVRPAGDERGASMIETVALGSVTVALLVYLVYALLRPEKF
jgi:K+-transporting ATPase KdpF subunit